jgi:hypothetical protein
MSVVFFHQLVDEIDTANGFEDAGMVCDLFRHTEFGLAESRTDIPVCLLHQQNGWSVK